ncbi:MAG: hypothetical protein QGI25_08895, partial [Arenicellales bacterium]|nr:hypothetical protein [Arenicellales bacterium]
NMGGGGVYDAAGNWFLGSIDDVAVWNIALSEDQIAALAAQQIFPIARGGELVPGMIAYWPFDGDLNDAVGDSHGEGMGTDDIAYGSGKFGQGIDLDGIDQFVQTPVENEEMFDFQDGTGFSVSAWFSVTEFTKNWQALIAKGEGNRWRVHRRSGEPQLTGNGGNADVPGGTGDVNVGEIHHVVLVSDPENGEVRLYSDGELVSTGGAPNIESNDNPMMIGQNPDTGNRTWSGIIDDVGIWDRPITEEEIATIWNDGDGTPLVTTPAGGRWVQAVPDMIAYWPFDSASEIEGDLVVVDLVAGLPGRVVEGNTEDPPSGSATAAEGRIGGAIDLGEGENWVMVDAEETGWLAPASDADQLSVSLWQRAHVVRNSTTFWFGSASATGRGRNASAHLPWGNNTIYFDTAGCCGADTRTNGPANIDFLEWHHFVLIKNEAHKEIWIDGELFLEGENTGTLFDDWTNLNIGSGGIGGTDGYVAAVLDEFGVWARAITPEEIATIYNGGEGIPLMQFQGGAMPAQLARLTPSATGFVAVLDESTAVAGVDVDSVTAALDGAKVDVFKS